MPKKELKTSITINAKPEIIWEILMDFEKYNSWNPFIRNIYGKPAEGEFLKANIAGMKFKPIVLKVEKNKEFRWKGKLFVNGIFDGEHIFQIIDNKDGSSLFVQKEKFSGLLVGLFSSKLDKETLPGFKAMNEKLKEIAEAKS